MKKVLDFLRERWGLETYWDVAVVFFIFAITGLTSVRVRNPIFHALDISWSKNWVLALLAYIFIFFPVYQLLFLTYGYIFGQFEFTLRFEKKMLGRFLPFIKDKND